MVDPSGRYLYAADVTAANKVAAYAIAPSTGVLTVATTVGSGTTPLAIAIEPLGKFIYAANAGTGNVSAYSVNPATGVLTPIPGAPFPAGGGARSIAID